MSVRRSIPTFNLANPVYVGASVTFVTVDGNGVKTSTKATLYAAATGSTTLTNPQSLDSAGKFEAPVYVDVPVVGEVSGLSVADHDTGIISVPGVNRGSWATATVYYAGEFVTAGSAADSSNDICIIENTHTSGTYADDISSGELTVMIDVSALSALFSLPDPSGNGLKHLRVNSGGTAWELIAAAAVLAAIGGLAAANDLSDLDSASTARGNMGLGSAAVEASSAFEAADTDILKADTSDNLTVGFTTDEYAKGTVSSGTWTVSLTVECIQPATNGGAFILAPPSSGNGTAVLFILNNGSAGAITTSGFTKVTGDSFDTTNTNKFMCVVFKSASYSVLNITALQ